MRPLLQIVRDDDDGGLRVLAKPCEFVWWIQRRKRKRNAAREEDAEERLEPTDTGRDKQRDDVSIEGGSSIEQRRAGCEGAVPQFDERSVLVVIDDSKAMFVVSGLDTRDEG